MSDEGESNGAKIAMAVGAVAVAAGVAYLGYKAYADLNGVKQENDPNSSNPLLRPKEDLKKTGSELETLLKSADDLLVPAGAAPSGEEDPVFPFTFEEYSQTLAQLHQCFCGNKAGDGFTLSRCATCKATYYCTPEHQKMAWATPPFKHKDFCPRLVETLDKGFAAIGEYMERFSPQNAPNVQVADALEGWSIVCAALERRLFKDDYEEMRLLHWAGTTHAMLCGQLMREKLKSFEFDSLLEYFRSSINFFENVLQIAARSERGLEVAPSAYFELFGLWSSLGLSLKDSDPKRMEIMFQRAADRFGIPAISQMLEFVTSQETESDEHLQSLQQWSQSVVTILTQKKASFTQAESVVTLIGTFAESSQNIAELHLFTTCLYQSAVQAHQIVSEKSGNPDDATWGQREQEIYAQARQAILQSMMQQAFPEVMAQMGQQPQ